MWYLEGEEKLDGISKGRGRRQPKPCDQSEEEEVEKGPAQGQGRGTPAPRRNHKTASIHHPEQWHDLTHATNSLGLRLLPPGTLDNDPRSNHCHQRVEGVDLTGGDGDGESQQQCCALLHRRTCRGRMDQIRNPRNGTQQVSLTLSKKKPWQYYLQHQVRACNVNTVYMSTTAVQERSNYYSANQT